MSNAIVDKVLSIGIVPVVTYVDPNDSTFLADALCDGGIPVAEVTFRMDDACTVIKRMREARPNMIVGAGTVTSIELAKQALDAGVQFIVSPGLNMEVVEFSKDNNIPLFPGAITPSEIEKAIHLGFKTIKFFPAVQSGGIDMMKALNGPYPDIMFMPTGGIGLHNIKEFSDYKKTAACGGAFMIGNFARTRQWAEITHLCKKSVRAMLDIKLAHVGIHAEDAEEACTAAGSLQSMLMAEKITHGSSSIFIDESIEVVHSRYLEAKGHIAYSTSNIDRAIGYFTAIGVLFNEDTTKKDEKGNIKAIYFNDKISGFAIHLVQKN